MDKDRRERPERPVPPPSPIESVLSTLLILLAEMRSQSSLITQTKATVDDIQRKLNSLELYNMALPDIVATAISTEIEEGLKLQTTITDLNAQIEALKALQAATPTPGLGEAIINIEELSKAIAAINPSPLSDAVVAEVIANPEIETPTIVDAAPEVAPEVIQAPEVATAALEAIVSADVEAAE